MPWIPGLAALIIVLSAPPTLAAAIDSDTTGSTIWVLSRVDRSLTIIDPARAVRAGRVGLGARTDPGTVAYRDGSLWVGNSGGSLQRIDVATRALAATVPLEIDVWTASAAAHGIYAMDGERGVVTRHDPETGQLVATLDVPDRIHAMAAGPDFTAVIVGDRGELHLFPPGATQARVVDAEIGGGDMVLGFGSFWIYHPDGRLLRVDPASGAIQAEIGIGEDLYFPGISIGEDAVWVASGDIREVIRIDPATDQVAGRIPVDGAPAHVAALGTDLWVAFPEDDLVLRIDPASGQVTGRVRVDAPIRVVAVRAP
jgi:hypothetical protein